MTGYSPIEENTLGVEIGKRGKPKSRSSSPAARALRQMSAGTATLGTGYLGIGFGLVAGLAGVFGLALFALHFDSYPDPIPVSIGWVLYCLTLLAVGLTVVQLGEKMPGWLYIVFAGALSVVIALDFISIWPLGNIGEFASASIAATVALLMAVHLRPGWEIATVLLLFAAAFVVSIFATTVITSNTAPAQMLAMAEVILPASISLWFLVQFRRLIQLQLDRVLVQSTVSAPRMAVGMLASEELARLDLAAEELFDSIASGRTKLPLEPKTASAAASLATELRLHLIEGRRETWLYHAISESELLGRSVTLSDPGSLAGLMNPEERDGLLSAVWLLLLDAPREKPTMRLTLGPAESNHLGANPESVIVPIEVSTTGHSANKVDPAIWAAIAKVGSFTSQNEGGNLNVRIECVVSNPAEQYHAEQAKRN